MMNIERALDAERDALARSLSELRAKLSPSALRPFWPTASMR